MHYFEGAGVVQMWTCGRGKCHIGIRIIAWSEFFIETRRLDVMIEWVKGGAYPTIFSSSVQAPGGLCTTMAVGRSLSWRKLTKETKATTKSGKNSLELLLHLIAGTKFHTTPTHISSKVIFLFHHLLPTKIRTLLELDLTIVVQCPRGPPLPHGGEHWQPLFHCLRLSWGHTGRRGSKLLRVYIGNSSINQLKHYCTNCKSQSSQVTVKLAWWMPVLSLSPCFKSLISLLTLLSLLSLPSLVFLLSSLFSLPT